MIAMIDGVLALFQKYALECVGGDIDNPKNYEGIDRENKLRAEIRERIKSIK
ncbi:MAG: hypothetical protein WCQ96_03015 [Patescibacteria group bacterium]